MFEAHVLHILRQYLGEYVRGLSAEALSISVWKGDVVLKDLQLKAEALNSLRLPITVKAGFLGSVTLKVPWNRLGKEPVIVLLDRIFILAEPTQDERHFKEEDKEKLLEAKRRQVEEAELAMLEAKDKKTAKLENSPEANSWFGSLVATIVGNLKISISNVHIRYEDSLSNPGKPFCSGITLSKLAAVTTDDNGVETFVTSGALDRLCKSLQLQRFAVYHDSNGSPWKMVKSWEDMMPQEWSEIFEVGINHDDSAEVYQSKRTFDRQYLLRPVDGIMQYYRRGKQEKRSPNVPFQKISLVLNEVVLTISEDQYCDALKLLEGISRYRTRVEFSHFRPLVSVMKSPQAWWVYACQAGLQQQQRKMWYHLSWERVFHLCKLRRKYVELYATLLQQNPKVDNQEICKMEEELDAKVVLLWRLLAHAKVESVRSKEAALERERLRKSSWLSFGWASAGLSRLSSGSGSHAETEAQEPGHLTKEEWNKINELLSYQPGEKIPSLSNQEAPNMLQVSFDATIGQSAVCIVDKKKIEILCGKFENLKVGLNLYPKTVECDAKLQFYGLSAPEGPLIESVSTEGKEQALAASFVHSPLDESLDWKFSATMSPCYVTVWLVSFERFTHFLKSSHAMSPDVALETATLLQNKLEQVTRRAQEHLQLALEERSRFSVDIDLDAPKVRIPVDQCKGEPSQLMLDLGHFTLHTANMEENWNEDTFEGGLYSQVYISGSEITAFFADGLFDWADMHFIMTPESCHQRPVDNEANKQGNKLFIFPVLDRCGMSILFEQIYITHPSYPSTRVAIKVPHLGLHFSPARYDRLMRLLAMLEVSSGPKAGFDEIGGAPMLTSWFSAEHAGDVRVLFWKGLGNTIAEWQPCWAALAGSYLYILESESAQTYQRYSSMSGKQVLEVPSSNIGGSENAIAVCNRGVDLQKGLESSNTIILQLKDDASKALWIKYLTLAVYKASAPIWSLSDGLSSDGEDKKLDQRMNLWEQTVLFVTGSLHELKLSLYGATKKYNSRGPEENVILELQADGGKVNLLQREHDLMVGMRLHSLKVEDKLQGAVSPSCQYVARSVLNESDMDTTAECDNARNKASGNGSEENPIYDGDSFKDALLDFGNFPEFNITTDDHLSFSQSVPLGASGVCGATEMSLSERGISPLVSSGAGSSMEKMFEESGDEASNFVSMQFISRQTESPDYDGTDILMIIRMATLDFFCNRPTVVALIDFGIELSEINVTQTAVLPGSTSTDSDATMTVNSQVVADRVVVKGLLGQGKSRVVFGLKMNVDSVRIFLNKEDGSQLAMLGQERFQMDLKVYPNSFNIAGTLGNLRVCDMSLGPDHQWGWFCDIRDPGCDSLVKLDFKSFSMDEDDFQGYDYSLCGKLSAVRIVFLYRFIQEITAYFVGMATPQAQKAIRVVDKVGGIERLIPQSDIDGAPAVKLDITLDTPILLMPQSSLSNEFMQLDLGHLQVHNTFEWHGGGKDDASAVLLDVLSAEITGINMVVGIGGIHGKAMIQEAGGLLLKVRRPLRDLFKKVPEVQVDVQVAKLRGIMSDKEYLVITDCAATNVAESPNLPPDFRSMAQMEIFDGAIEEEMEVSELVKVDSSIRENLKQVTSAWTATRVNVEVHYAELELYNGVERESRFARVELQGFWLGYRSSSTQEMDIFVSLPRLSVLDLRSDTKPEMRLMLGSMVDVEKNGTPVDSNGSENSQDGFAGQPECTTPRLTMFVMDWRMKAESQAIVIRIQQPRLLVVLDFLLAMCDFFVPNFGAITGKDDTRDIHNDPIVRDNHIRLMESFHKQEEKTVTLSYKRQLIADSPDFNEFTYDGDGGVLCLDVPEDYRRPFGLTLKPAIVVGSGKKLRFKNVIIKNGFRLKDSLQLNSHSSYSIAAEDAVVLEVSDAQSFSKIVNLKANDEAGSPMDTSNTSGQKISVAGRNFMLRVQAVAPELTFYDSAKLMSADSPRQEKLLRAKMDFFLEFDIQENDKWIHGVVKGLSVEGGSGLAVVDPLDISAKYACVKEKTTMLLSTSDISIRLSFSLTRLLTRLHDDAISAFQFGGAHVLSRCTHFDRLWVNTPGENSGQNIAIWRPRAPRGFAILSDCVTSGAAPPSQAVMAVRNTYHRVKQPCGFELVWSSIGQPPPGELKGTPDQCCIWRPIAPPGYVTVGCVAGTGFSPPPLSAVHCVRSDLVTSASISDCVFYEPPDSGKAAGKGFSMWRIDNVVNSFFAHLSVDPPSSSLIYDLREILCQTMGSGSNDANHLKPEGQFGDEIIPGAEQRPSVHLDESLGITPKPGRYYTTTAQFERMWWDKGSDSNRAVSIWRPVPPLGYAFVGDSIIEGLEPPSLGIVLRDDSSGRLAKPIRFLSRMHTTGKGNEDIFIWYPVAPAGYVTLGCVVSKTEETPSTDMIRCVRMDLVNEVNISKRPIWINIGPKNGYSCSLWRVQNQANTFLARPDLKQPPDRLGYGLVETGKKRLRENMTAEMKIGRLSLTVFDDLSGLMTPLADITITSINLVAHGGAETLNAVVVSAIAASTFNTQLQAWEPLIEPVEGIFKYESYDANSGLPLKAGRRIRITAANVVNLNVTSANVEALVGASLAWRKQDEHEQQVLMAREQENDNQEESSAGHINSALEEDDSEKFVLENKLGGNIYLRTFQHEFKDCQLVEAEKSSIVRLPPPKFPDKLNTSTELRRPTQHVGIHIAEARELPVNDDGNVQDFFFTLSLASTKQPSDKQNTIPQIARSRCVRPSAFLQSDNATVATAKWNEVFVFDVPQQGSVSLEVVVSNQAAKGGKGEVVGKLLLPLNEENGQRLSHSSSLWKFLQQSISQMFQTSWPNAQGKVFPLQPPKKKTLNIAAEDDNSNCGFLTINMYFFMKRHDWHVQAENNKNEDGISDIGVWIGPNPNGPWAGIGSVLPLGTVPRQISNDYLALEVRMQQGKKHAILRSLVTVFNDTDMALDVCVCPMSLLNSPDEVINSVLKEPVSVTEEMFENQRYQPLVGWGSKWPGHLFPTDPGRWSNCDYSKISQSREDFENQLLPGWIWKSSWDIDKVGYVDEDGWAYGSDFQSLKWPPNSSRCCKRSRFDFVRRRRWVRTRQRIPERNPVHSRQSLVIIHPRDSISLPWASTAPKTDNCVQVRPHSDIEATQYLWGRAVNSMAPSNDGYNTSNASHSSNRRGLRSNKNGIPVSLFMLNQLEKTEELLLCVAAHSFGSRNHCWLSMEADAKILYTDLNSPIYDWRLSVNAPLKLENLLPCAAEYTIWQKPKEGNPVKRDRGVVFAAGNVYIYSADIRKPIFLTWLVQGGWKLEKEIVLISDLSMEEIPSGFTLVNQQSGRRLRVRLEHDFGGTNAAAKIVRLFVPYWLCNKAAVPLAYCLVEIEPDGGTENDNSWLMRAVKAAKHATRRPSSTSEKRRAKLHRVVQYLEAIEDSGRDPVMLSPQSQYNRTGFSPFSPRADDGLLSPRLGISVAALHSNNFSGGISFRDLENNERVDVKAIDENGAYYKLSTSLDMLSGRTKVVNFQPHTLFVNMLGKRLYLRQCDVDNAEVLLPNDPPKIFLWQSTLEPELLKICIDGHKWSSSFSVDSEGMMHIILKSEHQGSDFFVRAEVQNGANDSRFLVVFHHVSYSNPYRIENQSVVLPFRFRQAGGGHDSWQLLQPGFAVPFAWEDLRREHQLEILVDGADPSKSRKYNIDETADHQPLATEGGPVAALHVTTFKEGLTQVIRVGDWMPSNKDLAIVLVGNAVTPHFPEQVYHSHGLQSHPLDGSENQFHISIELAEFGLSIVDQTPEELLYLSVQNLILTYGTGLGSGISRFKLRLDGLQVDNQFPLTPMPVLFRPQASAGSQPDFLLKCTLIFQDNGSPDQYIYPFSGIQGPSVSNIVFLVSIHEPFIWRLHEMLQQLDLSRLTASQTTGVAVDPIINIGLSSTPEIRFKVSLAMSPTQRPRGVLGFWASLMTALGNTDDMPIRIAPRVHEDICMQRSALVAAAISNIRKDLLSHPLQLLSGVDILGNASSALGHMSKGVAALSMDKKFIRSRQKQDSKAAVEGFGDGFREGAEALGKGLFRGFTGILTKPLEGARSSGVEGFVQGVGKGIIGVAAQPVSGVLDLLSKTTEGANAMRMKIAAVITSEEQLLRRRLPRAIGGDNVLRPYDEYKAQGQILMQLAERGTTFGPMELFKTRGKFAISDAYEDHYNLPKGRTLIVTHRRLILLQHPTSRIVQKKPDLQKDPCTVLWDVTWIDLMTMELSPGKDEASSAPPSRLILHLRNWPQDMRIFDSKEPVRIIKCHPGTHQAAQIRAAIQQALSSYGPERSTNASQSMQQRKVRKPYSGIGSGAASEETLGLLFGKETPITMPLEATFGYFVRNAGQTMVEAEGEVQGKKVLKQIYGTDKAECPLETMPPSDEGPSRTGRFISDFIPLWRDKGAHSGKRIPVSIWRPVTPSGYVLVGDVAHQDDARPVCAMVYWDNHDGKFAPPEGFNLVWRDMDSSTRDPITIWMPRPPPNYVAVGCVVVPDYYEPDPDIVRCVHMSYVKNTELNKEPLWKDSRGAALWHCSLWHVHNEAHTFLARRDHQVPPESCAYSVVV